jgi:hypothetical protein
MSYFEDFYNDEYFNSINGFDKFHNEVINMPRDAFSDAGIEKIRMWAGYLLITKDNLEGNEINFKEVMEGIKIELDKKNVPKYRDLEIEKRYFKYNDINKHYEKQGRMFRHVMSLCDFFGFFHRINKKKKKINYNKCAEYYLADDDTLMPIARNNIMMINAKDNSFIAGLSEIIINEDADYKPTYAILEYIHQMKRSVTKFELSVLLGRIDNLKTERYIMERALAIGRILPCGYEKQKEFFFKHMGWMDSEGRYFPYRTSQEPDFKFNSYLLFLEKFELIEMVEVTREYKLTEYASNILEDTVSYLIPDLEKLIERINDYDSDNSELNELILKQRNYELLKLAREDKDFIRNMNFRSLNNPIIKKGKRKRNRLIAELAKIEVKYICQYTNSPTFRTEKDGRYYCEAHHIIEFSTENGPDITNNLLVLGPEPHKLLHLGYIDDREDAILHLVKNNKLEYNRFEEMVSTYKCLSKEQIYLLKRKKILTSDEVEKLIVKYDEVMA